MKEKTESKSISEELENMEETLIDGSPFYLVFSELEKVDNGEDVIDNLQTLTSMCHMMLYNIQDYAPDKTEKAKQLIEEFYKLANTILENKEEETINEVSLLSKLKEKFIAIKNKLSGKRKRSKKKVGCDTDGVNKESSFMVWKDNTGKYRWFARYSNNYRDDDLPAEIISKKSHSNFVDMVDNKEAPYPELWHWHIPGSKWGQSDWVAYDDDNGIAMASGYIDEGHEKEASRLSGLDIEIGVSHGMPQSSIVRDDNDSTIITRHITKEISDLPLWAAANKLTSFTIFKELEMGIPAKKKDYLKSIGLTDGEISDIEVGNSTAAKQASDSGIESKEATIVPVDETPVITETVVEETKIESVPEVKEVEVEKVYITSEQLVEVVGQITEAIGTALKSIRDEISGIKTDMVETKSKREEVVSTMSIPTASLSAMIAKQMSAIGSDETIVKKNTILSKSGPEETSAPETEAVVETGNPLINTVISNIIGRRN